MAGNANSFLNKYSDIVLAVVVIAIVGMMIVPLPTHLLDILLTFNISLSVIIVLMGAELDAEMEHQTARDTTTGGGKPLGSRGARMADTIGEARS